MKSEVDLTHFTSKKFNRGANRITELLWILVRFFLFLHVPFGLYALKRLILGLFGGQIGKGVIIKPGVIITFPWKLTLGDYVWLGEGSWIHNLEHISIANNVCVSQRAMLCTGSHDYKSKAFDLITKPIILESGSWIAANAWVGPGVTVGSHAVLTAGSVASKNLEPYGIYQGNPAIKIKTRTIEK